MFGYLLMVASCWLFKAASGQPLDCVIDLVMAVDVSGSIQDTDIPGQTPNWNQVVSFMENVVQGLSNVGRDGTRIGIVTFGNRGVLEFTLEDYQDKTQYRDAVGRVRYLGGNTNTTGGLRVARELIFEPDETVAGNRPAVADVILLITDGKPTREADMLLPEVQRIKDMGIRIIGVGVTSQVNITLMMEIVTNRNTDYFPVVAFDDLAQILEIIIQETCRVIPTTTQPQTTPPPPTGCTNTADLFFLLDGSGSINEQNFQTMKTFVADLINELSVDNGRVRVGLTVFSTTVISEFTLITYNNRASMIEKVSSIQYPRGTTNTADALRFVRVNGYTSDRDRNSVPNILVVMTDGNSNDKMETLKEAFEVKNTGLHVLTVGIGSWTNVNELKMVASYPYEKNYIAVQKFSDLNTDLKMRLRNMICDNTNECNSNPCQNGGTCINMIEHYLCRCRSGFAGVNCETTCRVGNDIVFALDSSGSIGENNFLKELDFVREMVYGINMNDARVGVLEYSDQPTVQFHLNTFGSNKIAVINGLSMYYMGGTTNTAGALSEMRNQMFTNNNGDRSAQDNVGVVITDGRSNDFMQTWQQARQARDSLISLVAVGIGNNLADNELQAIASYPNGPNVLKVSGFDDLSSIKTDLLKAICNEVRECNSNPCQNGGECRDLLNGYRCNCRTGFSGLNCERGCDNRYDIVFVIDSSGSMGNRRFPDVLELVISIIEQFEVDGNKARIGAIIFSDNVEIRFNLNTYFSKQDVITGIRTSRFLAGKTNIASALETVKNSMFTPNNGDRGDVGNHVILVTDGSSNIRVGAAVTMAIDMRVDGAKITVLGVGSNANTLELRGMSSSPLEVMMVMAESFDAIKINNQLRNQIVNSIVDSTCDRINECNSNPCRNGGQCLDDLHSFWCECNNDYTGRNCERQCTNQMDVSFVLDFSGSLDDVFNIVIAFTKEVVYGLPVRFNRAKVSALSFSDDALLNFNLNKYTSKIEILNALSFSRSGGSTNTQSALNMMMNDVFSSGQGDRSGVKNIAIVVTDGGSNVQRDRTIARASEAKNRNIDIYVAAIGNAPDMGEVNGIASDPDSSFIVRIPDSGFVEQASSELLEKLCQ